MKFLILALTLAVSGSCNAAILVYQGINIDDAVSELTKRLSDHGYWNAALPYFE